MKITCCSRITQPTTKGTSKESSASFNKRDYKLLSAVGVEVHPRGNGSNGNIMNAKGLISDGVKEEQKQWCFNATDISRRLINQTFRSILTVNEYIVVSFPDENDNIHELVCRISEVRTQEENDGTSKSMTSAEATMDDPYRGRVDLGTELYIYPSDPKSVTVLGGRCLPKGTLPEDVVHVTTSDMEWFPVRRLLLAPCIKLTKYVQVGRGKYKNEIPTLSDEERSEDAPTDDGCPHCKVPIDCCTFDRVLLFITSLLYPDEHSFALDLSEVNALSSAADALGLQVLDDLCQSQSSTFESRVIKDRYIRLAEVKTRNDHGELLILLDGMVLDISRWIDEHPGGPSIIPTQALNIDCTVFFEMYHVSRQAFLYLKSFYIGELSPEDAVNLRSSAEGVEASEGFLLSLRSYTDEWRVSIEEKAGEKVHKSF
uniref:Cytochrome b5 heme-binding domain-containing protein n=1 Tax=Ditylum brightwellii TaxID=49249 RepID=A0A7S4QH31_9STRA